MENSYETYLQTAWGDSLDNISINDVRDAISEVQNMDDEHGVFWVGLFNNDENVLEVHKDLTIIGVFEDAPDFEIISKGKNWAEIENLYLLLLNGRIDELKKYLSGSK